MASESPLGPTPEPGWETRPTDIIEMIDFELQSLAGVVGDAEALDDLNEQETRALFEVWMAVEGARFNLIQTMLEGLTPRPSQRKPE